MDHSLRPGPISSSRWPKQKKLGIWGYFFFLIMLCLVFSFFLSYPIIILFIIIFSYYVFFKDFCFMSLGVCLCVYMYFICFFFGSVCFYSFVCFILFMFVCLFLTYFIIFQVPVCFLMKEIKNKCYFRWLGKWKGSQSRRKRKIIIKILCNKILFSK